MFYKCRLVNCFAIVFPPLSRSLLYQHTTTPTIANHRTLRSMHHYPQSPPLDSTTRTHQHHPLHNIAKSTSSNSLKFKNLLHSIYLFLITSPTIENVKYEFDFLFFFFFFPFSEDLRDHPQPWILPTTPY